MSKSFAVDERTEQLNGRVSFVCLMLTQLALVGVIVYKRYGLGLPMAEYDEMNWIVGLSMGGYWAARFYFNGVLPVIPLKTLAVIYGVAVALILIPTLLIVGWPAPERWYEVLYPFIGVAVIMAVYILIAYFGKRRLGKFVE